MENIAVTLEYIAIYICTKNCLAKLDCDVLAHVKVIFCNWVF